VTYLPTKEFPCYVWDKYIDRRGPSCVDTTDALAHAQQLAEIAVRIDFHAKPIYPDFVYTPLRGLLKALSVARTRVSEILALDLAQYHERGFVNVLRKGGHVQRFIPIQKQHREVVDEWLEERGKGPGPIF
jgi:integrase